MHFSQNVIDLLICFILHALQFALLQKYTQEFSGFRFDRLRLR